MDESIVESSENAKEFIILGSNSSDPTCKFKFYTETLKDFVQKGYLSTKSQIQENANQFLSPEVLDLLKLKYSIDLANEIFRFRKPFRL